jgi:very-short-patch-repair endonuclease
MSLGNRLLVDERKAKRRFQQARALVFKQRLKERATQAEQILCSALTDRHYWFRFQSCFYSPDILFIPDFRLALHHQKLIIELDGGYHENQRAYDEQRTRWLQKNRNCVVIRFTNDEVIYDLPTVMGKIAAMNPKKRGKC